MPNFINLPVFTEDGDVHVVVETPRGSRAKFAYDPKLETFALTKSLLTGLTYPHDWGFVPSTKADGLLLRLLGIPLSTMSLLAISYAPLGQLNAAGRKFENAVQTGKLVALGRGRMGEQSTFPWWRVMVPIGSHR